MRASGPGPTGGAQRSAPYSLGPTAPHSQVAGWGSNREGQVRWSCERNAGRTPPRGASRSRAHNPQLGPAPETVQALPVLLPLQLPARVETVACGSRHSVLIDADGALYAMGCGAYGSLGLGHDGNVRGPQRVTAFDGRGEPIGVRFQLAACGQDHTVAVGEVQPAGSGADAASRQARRQQSPLHTVVAPETLSTTRGAAAGGPGWHMPLPDHQPPYVWAFAWGRGSSGQLGTGRDWDSAVPQPVQMPGGPQPATAPSGGARTPTRRHSPLPSSAASMAAARAAVDRTVAASCGAGERGLYRGAGVRALSCGARHSALVSSAGELYTWGAGSDGRLGHGDTATRWVPTRVASLGGVRRVSCGPHHTVAVDAHGDLFTWGRNDGGALGHGPPKDLPFPLRVESLASRHVAAASVVCGPRATLVVDESGRLWGAGQPPPAGRGGQVPLPGGASFACLAALPPAPSPAADGAQEALEHNEARIRSVAFSAAGSLLLLRYKRSGAGTVSPTPASPTHASPAHASPVHTPLTAPDPTPQSPPREDPRPSTPPSPPSRAARPPHPSTAPVPRPPSPPTAALAAALWPAPPGRTRGTGPFRLRVPTAPGRRRALRPSRYAGASQARPALADGGAWTGDARPQRPQTGRAGPRARRARFPTARPHTAAGGESRARGAHPSRAGGAVLRAAAGFMERRERGEGDEDLPPDLGPDALRVMRGLQRRYWAGGEGQARVEWELSSHVAGQRRVPVHAAPVTSAGSAAAPRHARPGDERWAHAPPGWRGRDGAHVAQGSAAPVHTAAQSPADGGGVVQLGAGASTAEPPLPWTCPRCGHTNRHLRTLCGLCAAGNEGSSEDRAQGRSKGQGSGAGSGHRGRDVAHSREASYLHALRSFKPVVETREERARRLAAAERRANATRHVVATRTGAAFRFQDAMMGRARDSDAARAREGRRRAAQRLRARKGGVQGVGLTAARVGSPVRRAKV